MIGIVFVIRIVCERYLVCEGLCVCLSRDCVCDRLCL